MTLVFRVTKRGAFLVAEQDWWAVVGQRRPYELLNTYVCNHISVVLIFIVTTKNEA